MRQIKFRVKSLKTNVWVYGQILQGNTQAAIMVVNCDEVNRFGSKMVKPLTVCQFIGVCDMDGQEIYEGDVLVIEGIKTDRYSKVWWNDERFTFYVGHSPISAYILNDGRLLDFRIAGNIYDNPELKEKLA